MNHQEMTLKGKMKNRNNICCRQAEPCAATPSRGAFHHALHYFLTAITMLFALGVNGAWGADAKLCARFVDTNKSKWDYRGLTIASDKVVDKDSDQEIYFVTNSGKNTLKSAKYLSSQSGAIMYIPVPSGSAGTVTMTANSSTESRYYQLMVGENGNQNQRLYSKFAESLSDDGKKGPQSFTFASSDITILNDKTYLKLVATGGEMKVNTFTVELTEGTYTTISSAPVFTTDLPSSLTISAGSPHTFAPVVEQGFSYQWYKDDVKIDGAIYPTYTYTPENVGTASFKLVVENSQGSTTSTVCAVTATLSDARRLITASFSNGFDAFITEPTNENNGKVQVYYVSGTSEPTLTNTVVSSKATASAIIDGKITVTAENGQTAIYDVAIDAVTPLAVTPGTDISETTFTELPAWIKAPYGYDGTKGIKFGKNEDPRISNGQNRICLFIAKSKFVTLTNTGVTSDRNIKVYVNGTEVSGITSIGKNSGNSNSITITTSQVDGPVLISIVSNQTGGDGGFTKYSVVAPDAVSPEPVGPVDLSAELAAQNTPQGWTAVSLPNITINTTVTLDDLAVGVDNAAKIQAAINAASTAGGGKVVIPAGEWLSGQLFIKSNVVLHLSKNCTLKMLPYGTYPAAKENYFIGTGSEAVNDVIIEGEDYTSIIDGQGAGWWTTFDENNDTRPAGLVRFRKGARYLVRNIQFQNSPKPNLVLGDGGNASHFTVHDVKIVNPSSDSDEATADGFAGASHNTDGIPVWGPYCNIYKCNISTGDDNVVFDSNSQYCHVWDCDFGRGHGASIGSNTMNVHDILWDNIRFNGTQSGFKIKTDRAKGNELYNITYQNSTMTGVRDILYMDCFYGLSTKPTPGTYDATTIPNGKESPVPAWHDITYKNITATNCVYRDSHKNGFPIYFYGLPESHIKNVTLDNVTIEGQKGMFMAYVGENDAQGVTFQNGCNITNVNVPTAAAFVTEYSAVHNDAYVTAAEPLSSEKQLLQAKFSNGFDAFINESAHTVTAYYMQGESVPTLVTKKQSEKATTSIAGNTITVTAEDGTTRDYALTLTDVAPYTTTGERQFDGSETWIKTGGAYTTEASSKIYYAWVINKNAEDGRIQLGKTRIYFFVGNSDKITLINDRGTSLSADRAIKVYVNGEEKSSPTSMKKYNSETPASIDIETGGPAMIEIAANQTSGDTGWGKIIVTPESEEPKDIVLYDLKNSVGSATVGTNDASMHANTSYTANENIAIGASKDWAKITCATGQKFKNGDKLVLNGTVGNTAKAYSLQFFTAADKATEVAAINKDKSVVGDPTNAYETTLTLASDVEELYIFRVDDTTMNISDLTISRPASTPDPEPTPTYPITATWDFSKAGYSYTGSELHLAANTDEPLEMTIHNTGVRDNGNSLQFNTGTTLKIPVVSTSDVITVTNYGADGGQYNADFTIGNESATTAQTKHYSPTPAEVETGFVTLTVNNQGYLIKIKLVQQDPNPTPAPTPSYPITATWDFKNGVPSTITSVNIQGKIDEVASDNDGIKLAVDATVTDGKLQYNASGYAQFNNGTTIHVPVTSKYDEINVVAFPGQNKYTIGGAAAAESQPYNPSEAEATLGYVEIKATGGAYLYSISVIQQGADYVPAENWDPTWDGPNNRWVVKTSDNVDAAVKATENAKGLTEALKYLNVAANVVDKNKTLYIPNGTYDLGETALTTVPADFHLIGESQDGVIIKNQLPFESIKYTATLKITGANVTLENMTIKCRATYGKEKKDDNGTIQDSSAERGVCVQDCGNGSHYINVTLDGLQDTYYSNGAAGMTATFDNCIVRGNVDFFCGNGDITVNDSRLQIVTTHGSGGTAVICAPATFTTETQGYLFNNCIVEAATSPVDCLVTGHSTNQKFALARGWYAGNGGTDRTPRVTFQDTEFEIKPKENWTTMSDSQPGGAPVFQIINTGVQFTDEAKVIDKTNKPFAYATANDRTNPASVSASNITGGGEYDLETIMQKMEAGDGYTVGETKTIDGHKAIVLQSADTISAGKVKHVPMDDAILNAIKANDIIVLDGSGTSADFVLSHYIRLSNVNNKTIVGINGARLCTEWYLTDYFKSLLENVPTSSGTGVNSASTTSGGGSIEIEKNGSPYIDNIPEEGEYLTRKTLLEATGDKKENYRNAGIFYIDHSSNLIIRNFKFIGPGSLDCAGYDLMAIIDDTHHCWVDHCEFVDGMDGNFDITNRSDFVTVSWCQFRYTDRSYAHQNTNLVGSDDAKTDDRGKLNITFAYNEWGANCRARMPMARYGRIHMLNNYYNCAGNSEYAMNPRKESEFLVEGNYWEKGVRRAYNPNGQTAVTWGSNFYADKAAANAGSSMGTTVTVPYQYSALMLDPMKVPEVVTLNGGAKLYQKPRFTTNLRVADNTPGTPELQHNAELTEELKEDGLVFSVWAENAHTFQWYKQDIDVHGNTGEWTMLEGEQRNTYTFKPVTGVEFNLKCQAFGVSGETTSDILKVKIDGLAAPYYLGGMPTEMQTVYTGTPMTFTANFKDATAYQWYKNTTNEIVVDDAHKIKDATSNTYTYEPSSAEIFYLYCVASNSNGKGDGYSNNVKVKGIYRDVKFHYYGNYNYEAHRSEEVVEGGTGGLYPNTEPSQSTFHTDCTTETTKCTASLNSIGTDALHDKVSGLRFENKDIHTTETFFADNTYVLFNLNNALVAGQTVRLSGFTGKTDSPNEKFGFYVCTSATKTADNTVATLKLTQKKNTLEYAEAIVPASCAGAEKLYVIPFVDKAGRDITLHDLMVYAGETVPADDPTVTVETESPVSAKVGNEVVVRITATDAQSYQWYKNSTEELVFDEEHKIAGQTNANLSYTPEAEGTEFVYCRVIGKKADTHVDTPIIQLNISEASASQSGTLAVTWPLVDGSNKYTAAPAATITGDITVENEVLVSKDNVGTGSKLQEGSNGAGGTKLGDFTDKNQNPVTYGQYTVTASDLGSNSAVHEDVYLKFTFTPKVSFKPEKISFLATINGTGNGCFQPVLIYGNGVNDKKNLDNVKRFTRDSTVASTAESLQNSYDISDITVDPNTPISLYIYVGGVATGKSICFKNVKIEGQYVKEELTQCLTPSVVKGNWDAEHQQWEYTLACAQPETAKIHYKIGDADAVEAPTNPVTIKVSEDVAFSVWASDPETDPDAKLKDSKTVEMTGDVRPQLAAPSILFATYNVAVPAERGFLVTLTDNNDDVDNVTLHYTIDGSEPTTESAAYSAPFLVGGDVTVKAIATKTNYASSKEESAKTLSVNSVGSETTTNKNTNNHYSTVGENVGFAYTYNDNDKTVQNANKLSDGLKFTTNAALSIDDKTGFAIKVNPGFVITKVVATKATTNNDAGSMTFGDVYVDGQKNGTLDKKLPYYGGSNDANAITFTVAENIAAKDKIEVVVTSADVKNNQANVLFTVFYEFDDAPASVTITDSKNSEDVITLEGDDLAAFKTNHTYTVDVNKVYAEDPIVKITTEKGYEYIVPAGDIETDGDKLTHFTKSFVGVDYTVKAKVNAVKSPNIEIANDMSLKGGYKVTLTYSKEDGIYPYINVDNTGWEAYDPEKEYFALGTVNSKMKYGSEQSLETVARSADCPDNSYTAGKPFAVYLYVNGYQDNQTGANIYNNQSFGSGDDKIYSAIANQFNVIPLAVNNSDAILEKRSDITDAKLVVITETLGGSGSVEIAGVGNKSNMMALTLKRDVLDKTNVLNLKMFLNGSSAANNQRWQWAQPRAMTSEITSIMPCTPDGGGMYEIFGNATMSRDASINLWDDVSTENMLYHLQPVFNFNEENETRPNFTPLALVIDPEEPEDQREQYHAIHTYKKGDFQYIGFGLSINEWKQYNNNVYAIIDKIGEMIKAGKGLDSKLTGIVKPTVTDNGDGSANVFNNNPNADTYYVLYTESEATSQSFDQPSANDIITNNVAGHPTFHANETDFHTEKFTEKMHIFAVSKLGADAESAVVEGTVEGNSIRYVIRENDDPAAQGMVAKYPFDLTVNSGTFNMPYNQSWKKDGYTVTKWITANGTEYTPGQEVSGLTQDITVKAVWTENTKKITDLGKNEDKAHRTVTWEFLQSKGAPALAMESKAGNMQAILVGQAKFSDGTFIDVPMTINTDNLATLPDNGTEYHGKFNNTSTNWAKQLKDTDGETVLYTGSDYAQVRTGTQFTFPMVYGSNVVYKGVELVEAVNGKANGNVNRSQISQSYITDGSKTADALNYWRLSNPGFELDPGWTGPDDNKVLQPNSSIVMVDGVAQLATTSPTYEKFKASMGAMGYDNILYDEDNEHNPIGGNFNYGGLIYYDGEATMATLTSVESAQYVHVGADTGKKLGGLNSGSVFMQSLSVTYPALYDLTCTWNPEYSKLDKDEHPGKIEKLTVPRPNCGGRYVLYDDINLKLTPAYGYYVDVDNDEVRSGDVVTKEAYYFLMDGNHPGQALNLVGATSHIYRYKDTGYNSYSDEIKANIPEDGAYITMKVQDIDLVVSMKKWETVKYHVEVEPSTYGYITFNSGNGRPHEDEYEAFPVGKKLYVTAHPNTGYKFKEWRRKTNEGLGELISDLSIPNITLGDGVMVNPFDKNDFLETNELMFIAGTDNHGYNDSHEDNFTYVAVFEKAVTGTGYYEFDYALLKTAESQTHNEMEHITVSPEDKNQFPSEFTSELLNFPKYYTLFKPGYTLDHWVEIEGTTVEGVFTPTLTDGHYTFGKPYNPGSYYNFTTKGEVKHLVPVFTKNPTSYDYRATPVDIKWDLRVAERAQRVDFKSGVDGTTATTKIYYSTHATINGDVLIDVPLTITLGKKGKLVNDIEEEDKWCAMGEGTTIVIPSGLGAKFTIASLSKMETTTIDGVVPTSYTVEKIDDANVYLYTFTTQSEATSVTLKIGDDYTYYKYIRAELPAADAVPLTTTVNNPAFGSVEIAAARTTADTEDNETLLKKINATKVSLPSGEGQGEAYNLNLGTIVSLHAKRTHLYVLDYFEDGDGNKYYFNKDDETKHLTVKDKDGKDITDAATAVDEYLKMEKVHDFNSVTSLNDIQLTFQVQSYSESMHAVYKENTLYQVNYTSGEEAEGEAPGMTLVEDGESFTIPAENHHLYLDGQTLRYWMDEDGNKYDLGQSYTLGQTFTASKDLPSGIASGKGFTVPKKDIFLTPVFEVNDFTVMNLSTTATAKWPLSRKGGNGYDGNGDIVINFEGINGIYVTPLKLENGDFIDLKMDIRGENGKANNVNSTDRCQVNSGTIFGLPSSSNCTFTLNSANSSISAKIDGATVEGQQTVSSNYTGDKTQIDINFTGNTYLYEVVAQYKPVTTDLPELDYATVGNISLGALGTPLAGVKLSTLKKDGEVEGVPADLSESTTGIMPVVRGTATRGGYVDVTQATIDNPVATMLVKTRDGVTVSVYKIGFSITYPNIAPKVTDLKIDRKFQCDLQKMYENATSDIRVDGTNYINDNAYLRHLGVEGDNAANERVAINGVINIKFSTKMAETTIPAATFQANNGKATLGQAITALEGQTLTFTYKGLAVNTEYDFIIPAGIFKDVFYAESAEANKANHVYNEPIRIHFTTVENAISTDRRVINYVVTHNQASLFDADQAKMVADGARVQVASDELIKNLDDAGIPYGTLDEGVELANAYKEAGKRFYIFVPDGEYQLMGNDFVKSVSSPIGEDGKTMTLGKTENVYSGITTVSHDNVSITGQSQEKTIVYNHPVFEGLSNAATLKLNGGIANFYAQDMTLQNRFDFLRCRKVASKGVAPALWDRSTKPIFKNVKFDSYQDTYYTNANNQLEDTRGYAEDCTIMGYVDFICGDGDQWFQNCNMVVRQGVGSAATNMFAPRQYDTQKWGYVMNECTFSAENATAFDVNNGKMTIARPWANSPAETLIKCKYNVLSTDDGYKKMSGTPLVIRMQEYMSYDPNGAILDLSKRSLRNSTPAVGSYDAVMTPAKASEYTLFGAWGGEDGYDPTLYTAQVNMTTGIKQDDTFLTWDDQKEALCYFLFTKDNESDTDWKLFAVTAGTEFEMGNAQIDKWFCVRAANQRGGLGAPTEAFQYKAHESYKRELVNNNQVIDGWRWSTIYLDFDAKAPVVQHEEIVAGETKTVDDIYVYALVKVDATKLTFKRVKTMEKNCGYLIKARPRAEEYEFKYTEKTPVYYNGMTVPEYVDYRNKHKENPEEPDIQMPHMSLMNGSVTDKAAAGTAGYTLASKTSYGLGFYKYVGKTYNANYAWLDAAYVAEAQKAMADGSLSSAAKAGYMQMVFDDDIDDDYATDINGVYDREGSEGILDMILDPDAVIYDLHGRKVRADLLRQGEVYIFKGIKFKR